jgi:hypothetical protein
MSSENQTTIENQARADDPEARAEAKRILGEQQWPVTLELGTPVEVDEETIESLVFQKGSFGVLSGIGAALDRMPGVDVLIPIAARLSGQSSKVIESLDPDDVSEVIAIALAFFGRHSAVFADAKNRPVTEQQWPVTIKLGSPVKFGKGTVAELVFQKGNLGVLKGMSIIDAPNVDELIEIAARLSGRSLKLIESLDPDDAAEVIAIAGGFFRRCRGAGKRLSRR